MRESVRARGRSRGWRFAGALVLLVGLTAGEARAQGGGPPGRELTVTAQRDLDFGLLTPGTASSVYLDDAARRAEWHVQGRGGVTVSLLIPAALIGPGGAELPLRFASGDAAYSRGDEMAMTLFDPNVPYDLAIPGSPGFVRIFLGGTALPAASQPPGEYTATVTIIVAPR